MLIARHPASHLLFPLSLAHFQQTCLCMVTVHCGCRVTCTRMLCKILGFFEVFQEVYWLFLATTHIHNACVGF